MENLEYRLHHFEEDDMRRKAMLDDLQAAYPELRALFAYIEPRIFDPDTVTDLNDQIKHLEESVQGLENTAMFRDDRIIELEDMLDRARTWQSAQAFSAFSEGYQHGYSGLWNKADPAYAWKESKARAALELKKRGKP